MWSGSASATRRFGLALALACTASVSAAESNRVRTDNVEARLVSEVAEIAPNSGFWVGLSFKIRPGWHTYWINPGDSGLAASIEWQLPDGMVAGEIRWPVPHRFQVGGLMSYGYSGEVVLLTRMSAWPAVASSDRVALAANATWLVCEDICIPEEGRFELTLPVTDGVPSGDAQARALIDEYARRLPAPGDARAEFRATPDAIRLHVPLPADWPREASDIWFFPERFGVVDHAAPQPATAAAGGVELTLTRGDLKHERLERLRGVLVLRYGDDDARGLSVDARPG